MTELPVNPEPKKNKTRLFNLLFIAGCAAILFFYSRHRQNQPPNCPGTKSTCNSTPWTKKRLKNTAAPVMPQKARRLCPKGIPRNIGASSATRNTSKMITAQRHRICFVIGWLVCNSTLRRPLSRICGAAEQLQVGCFSLFFDFSWMV